MTRRSQISDRPPTPERVLERGLSERLGRRVRIASIEREAVDGYSTNPISRLRVELGDGTRGAVLFKRLVPKPGGDVEREVLLYERLLAGRRFGAPALYASLRDPQRARYWLFLEDVGEFGLGWCGADEWVPAFRWLARMHAAFEGREQSLRSLGCLEEHDARFYRALAESARASLAALGHPADQSRFEALVDRHLERTVAHLTSRRRTLVHGDMSCKNLLVQRGLGIRPIDWEWAAIGPGAWDLCKLLSGWGAEKPRFVDSYASELERHVATPGSRAELEATLVHCELVKALWYLRWWVDGCERPSFVTSLLDRVEQGLAGLGGDGDRA